MKRTRALKFWCFVCSVFLLCAFAPISPGVVVPPADSLPSELSDVEFWKLVVDLSEPGGTYQYENYVSNEITLQRVIPALRKLTKPGGVYLGVGPEQNFTYAAALQSKMAFVIDIRRQNMLELLLYKALFELSPNRGDFVSRLFSRRRPANPGNSANIDEKSGVAALFDAFENAPADDAYRKETFEAVKGVFSKRGFQLSGDDLGVIEKITEVFHRGGPAIDYGFESPAPAMRIGSPSYARLMNSSDRDFFSSTATSYGKQATEGRNWSYLATEDSFRYVREMQRKNMIIPVVGDFGGPTAIRKIGTYLKSHTANVTAFYVSNVESYLSATQLRSLYRNVEALPTDASSMFIRFSNGGTLSGASWWSNAIGNTSVVSPISDLTSRMTADRTPGYTDLLRLVEDPLVLGDVNDGTDKTDKEVSGRVVVEGGAAPPHFVIPVVGPGRPVLSITVAPQADGTFRVRLPLGLSQAGAASGLAGGLKVVAMLYGRTDLLRESFTVAASDTDQLIIVLRP